MDKGGKKTWVERVKKTEKPDTGKFRAKIKAEDKAKGKSGMMRGGKNSLPKKENQKSVDASKIVANGKAKKKPLDLKKTIKAVEANVNRKPLDLKKVIKAPKQAKPTKLALKSTTSKTPPKSATVPKTNRKTFSVESKGFQKVKAQMAKSAPAVKAKAKSVKKGKSPSVGK